MKKIYTAIVAMILASLVFVLSGCELAFDLSDKTPEDTQSHTAIVKVTDERGEIIATEMVTLSKDEIKEGKTFFEKDKRSEKAETGVSAERLEEAIKNNKNTVSTTLAPDSGSNNNAKPTQAQGQNQGQGNNSNAAVSTTVAQIGGSGNNQPADKPDTPYVQDDAAILASTQYMFIGRLVVDGAVTPYKIARSGSKMAVFTEMEGKQLGIVVTDNSVLMLSVDEKTYVEFTKEMMKENLSEDELAIFDGNALDAHKVLKETTTEKADGVEYTVYVYESGQKDYFIGKTIIKTAYSDGSVLYYDSVSAVVPSSVFAAPSGYKKTTLDEEGVSDFADAIDLTEPHSHDE